MTEKTGLTLESLAERLGLKAATLKKIRWGDIRLTEANERQLQSLIQNAPEIGASRTPNQRSYQLQSMESSLVREDSPLEGVGPPPVQHPSGDWEVLFDLAVTNIAPQRLPELLVKVAKASELTVDARARATELIAYRLFR